MKRFPSLRPQVLLLTLLLAVAGCGASNGILGDQSGGKKEYAIAPDQRSALPTFGGPDLADQSRTLTVEQYRGKMVLINYWGSWCAPCRAEAEDLQGAWSTLSAKNLPVQFLGVNVHDQDGAGLSFVTDKKITYPSILDPAQRTALALKGISLTIPTSLLIDKQGRVAYAWLRPVSEKEIESAVGALNAET